MISSTANAHGNAAYKAGELAQALQHYSDAISASRGDTDLSVQAKYLSNRCHVYNQLKEYDNAVVDATAALKLQPTHAKALVRRGLAHASLEHVVAAPIHATRDRCDRNA